MPHLPYPHESLAQIKLDLDEADFTQRIIINSFSQNQFYEPELTEFLMEHLRPGQTFFDLGANIGYVTLLAAALVGSSGRVISVEAETENVAKLKHNLALNQLTQVSVTEAILWKNTEPLTFYYNSDNSGGHCAWDPALHPFNQRSKQQPQPRTVAPMTLDQVWEKEGSPAAAMVKIDTEGAEFAILQGATAMLAQSPPPYIITEINTFAMERSGSQASELFAFMQQLSYAPFLVRRHPKGPVALPNLLRSFGNSVFNVVFIHQETT